MTTYPRQAIIDIGSNSIRLVVFGGAPRAPVVLFNEKLMAGLGRGVIDRGRLDPDSVSMALAGLARFAALLELMQPLPVRVVATAAVREASDGREFLKAVRALGLPAELLDGEGEAIAAGFGVISALPAADGLVADMGGGSLELVRVAGGEVLDLASLPLGAMRVASIRAGGTGRLRKVVRSLLDPLEWVGAMQGKPLYLVGGSWRTLARVHMQHYGWPLPVLGNYTFPADDARMLKVLVRSLGTAKLLSIPGIKSGRVLQLDDAAALLAALVAEANPSHVVISAFGLREGLLYQELDPATRALDPLIEGARHAVEGQLQVPGYAEALLGWTDPLFADEPIAERRLRQAVCLLFGTSWAANPDFRTIEGEDLALHGNWIGIDGADRAVMAMALHVALGGDANAPPTMLARLAPPERLARARAWGFALRLAQRLSGGAPGPLEAIALELGPDGAVVLATPPEVAALVDAAAERRLTRLAQSLARDVRFEIRDPQAYAPENSRSSGGRKKRDAA